jgi:hypothetical protein
LTDEPIKGAIISVERAPAGSHVIANARLRIAGLGVLGVAIVRNGQADLSLHSDAVAFEAAFSARVLTAVLRQLDGRDHHAVDWRNASSPQERAAAREALFDRGEAALEAAMAELR